MVSYTNFKSITAKQISSRSSQLYASVFLKSIAESFSGIFVPIFLLQLNYQLHDVAVYLSIGYFVGLIFLPSVFTICKSIGTRNALGIGTALMVLTNLFLAQIDNGLPYYVVAVSGGLAGSFYYGAYHLIVANTVKMGLEGSFLSKVSISLQIAGIVGPLIGALFITKFSFTGLFLAVAAILALSLIPLFMSPDIRIKKEKVSLSTILRSDSKAKAGIYTLQGMLDISAIFWPVFLYLFFSNVTAVGAIISVSAFAMVVITYLIGKKVDKKAYQMYNFGVTAYSASWILRTILITPMGLTASAIISSISSQLMNLTLGKRVYEDAKKTNNLISYMIFWELFANVGRFIMLALLLAANSIIYLFYAAAIISLLHLPFIKKLYYQK